MHDAANTTSYALCRGVLYDQSYAHITQTVTIQKGADDATAKQTIKHLLLSPKAYVEAFPVLQALHDQVSCSHGSSVGFFDPEIQFFLGLRGINEIETKKLLVTAFFKEEPEIVPLVDLFFPFEY